MEEYIMNRKIVSIDEEKCNGCGICAAACHEGAIEIINGKAKLLSDEYCDGLGDCLPGCPVGAIEIIERDANDYDEQAVKKRMESKKKPEHVVPCGCPGTAARSIVRASIKKADTIKNVITQKESESSGDSLSELRQWPVQLKLINPRASYLKNADLLVAADCTAYAYGDFHKEFIKNRITVIGCPKLDDVEYYKEKLKDIIESNDLKSITVVRMEVPCCGGIVNAVKTAMLEAKTIVPYKEVIIGTDGSIL
jgi:Fe-S-cluster-containing hydrogenase component 2